MANHKNDHEQISVTLREEIQKVLTTGLPNLPRQAREEAAAKVERLVERYSSPYPPPSFLKEIEPLAPGATRDIVDATIRDLEHRREMDKVEWGAHNKELDLIQHIATLEHRSVSQSRYLGVAAYFGCLAFSGTMALYGHDWLASLGFGGAAVGIIAQIIKGGTAPTVSVSASNEEKKPE